MYNRYIPPGPSAEKIEYKSCFQDNGQPGLTQRRSGGLLDSLRCLLPKSLDTSDLLLMLILVLLLIEDEDDEVLIILLMMLLGG